MRLRAKRSPAGGLTTDEAWRHREGGTNRQRRQLKQRSPWVLCLLMPGFVDCSVGGTGANRPFGWLMTYPKGDRPRPFTRFATVSPLRPLSRWIDLRTSIHSLTFG